MTLGPRNVCSRRGLAATKGLCPLEDEWHEALTRELEEDENSMFKHLVLYQALGEWGCDHRVCASWESERNELAENIGAWILFTVFTVLLGVQVQQILSF